MTQDKINELKAKAFDIIMKSDALFLWEDGDVYIDNPEEATCSKIKNITEEEHSFLALVMSGDYELAEDVK